MMNMPDIKVPKINKNWKQILLDYHSAHALYGMIFLEGLNIIYPYIESYIPLDQIYLGLGAVILGVLSLYFKVTYQPRLKGMRNEQAPN